MSLEEASEYALSGSSRSARPPGRRGHRRRTVSELTRREREVAVLVARGFTNRQVSTELSISERTAEPRRQILKKLGSVRGPRSPPGPPSASCLFALDPVAFFVFRDKVGPTPLLCIFGFLAVKSKMSRITHTSIPSS